MMMSKLKKFLCMLICFLFIFIGNEMIYSKVVLADNVKNIVTDPIVFAKSTKKAFVRLNNISFDKAANKVNMQLTGKPSKTKCFYLSDGNKIVIDIYDCINNLKTNKININNRNVLDVRNSQFSNNPTVSRVVVDLSKKIEYKLVSVDKNITLAFMGGDTANTDISKKPNVSPSPAPTPTPSPSPSTKDNVDNSGAIDNNTIKGKNEVIYTRTDKSTFHISNMKTLKYSLDAKTISFQLDNSYDLSSLKNINDDYVEGVEVVSAETFSTVIITMKDLYQPITEVSGDGINLVIGKTTTQPTPTPSGNKQRVVVIDPGHGGNETGAVGCGLTEKNLNLDISLRVKALLEAQNIKVYMTRTKDEYYNKSAKTVTEELTARAQYAGSLKADFFVSIHSNSATPSASGAETLYYPTDGPYKKTLKKGKLNSIDFAQIVQDELIKSTGAVNRKIVPRPNLVVLKYNQVVPILVEVGFVSNPNEAAKLKTDAYKQKIAQGICNGIIKAYSKN